MLDSQIEIAIRFMFDYEIESAVEGKWNINKFVGNLYSTARELGNQVESCLKQDSYSDKDQAELIDFLLRTCTFVFKEKNKSKKKRDKEASISWIAWRWQFDYNDLEALKLFKLINKEIFNE